MPGWLLNMPSPELRQALHNLRVSTSWVNGWEAGLWKDSPEHVGVELRAFKVRSEVAYEKLVNPVGWALQETRLDSMAVYNALETAMGMGKEKPPEEALRILKAAWDQVQDHLAVVQAAHQGAMDYLVGIKDAMKGQLLERLAPAGE